MANKAKHSKVINRKPYNTIFDSGAVSYKVGPKSNLLGPKNITTGTKIMVWALQILQN